MKWTNHVKILINENENIKSQIDQTGILNGNEIVLEFINNNEFGLAFEQLTYIITESRVYLTDVELDDISELSKLVGIEKPNLYTYISLELEEFHKILKLYNHVQEIVVKNLIEIWKMETPMTCYDWINWSNNIYEKNKFHNNQGIIIDQHGFGLSYEDKEYNIDFDFGKNGEITGFDSGRIWYFIKSNYIKTVFTDENQINKIIKNEVYEGRIELRGANYYYKNKLQH